MGNDLLNIICGRNILSLQNQLNLYEIKLANYFVNLIRVNLKKGDLHC